MKTFRHPHFSFFFILILSCTFISADLARSGFAPGGYTGAEGTTCISCHGGNPLNDNEGSVVIEGLPDSYTPGTTYNNISVIITHKATDRKRWGFAMKAVANGSAAGVFAENNPNVYINQNAREIGHTNAPVTPPSKSYSFSNISWTAPSNPTTAQQKITFFVSANAVGDNSDFIYASSQSISLNTTSSVQELNSVVEKINIINQGDNLDVQVYLSKASSLRPIIYSAGGQKILELPSRKYVSGNHIINIDASMLSKGTYILMIQNEGKQISKKFIR